MERAILIEEHCDKQFFTLETNFELTSAQKIWLNNLEGVTKVNNTRKYEYNILIGKLFNVKKIIDLVSNDLLKI